MSRSSRRWWDHRSSISIGVTQARVIIDSGPYTVVVVHRVSVIDRLYHHCLPPPILLLDCSEDDLIRLAALLVVCLRVRWDVPVESARDKSDPSPIPSHGKASLKHQNGNRTTNMKRTSSDNSCTIISLSPLLMLLLPAMRHRLLLVGLVMRQSVLSDPLTAARAVDLPWIFAPFNLTVSHKRIASLQRWSSTSWFQRRCILLGDQKGLLPRIVVGLFPPRETREQPHDDFSHGRACVDDELCSRTKETIAGLLGFGIILRRN